ncbi:DUF4349 domain-containing protein [Lewinella sp. 4G2]|uniref:DUF4349 domain-containing protein n=1 Tax=Lewinella sp. 4G2 TaxID=1803372 RepID=UPI0007B48C16|nr:DUF4349 domain-containing protein [Lewinella sp. 4G2]OAV43927.1 hypothetical protein A3850_005215 [Lewinella sp. 4G2]
MRILLFGFLLLLISCGQTNSYEDRATIETASDYTGNDLKMDQQQMADGSAPPPPPPPPGENISAPVTKVIKTGSMAFGVEDLGVAKLGVDSLLAVNGAYYEKEEYRTAYRSVAYALTIRVPAANFETLLAALEAGTGTLTTKSISARDVTEEYVDLSIRLDNKLAYLEQYQTILKRARTIEEILEVQEKIRLIEEEIESKKGRLKFLDDRVGLSTLQLTLTEDTDAYVAEEPGVFSRAGKALLGGATNFLDVLIGLLYLWPFLLILVGLFFFRRPILNLFRRSKSS